MQTGSISTPGPGAYGKVKSMGRVPKVKETKQMISDEL